MRRRLVVPATGGLGALLLGLSIAPEAPAAPGDLDMSFGDGGKVFTSFGYGTDTGRAVAVQADGKMVVAGYSEPAGFSGYDAILLVRYNPDDTIDAAFGIDGKVITDVPGYTGETANAVKIQADGKIVVGGFGQSGTNRHFLVLRYNADGTLDSSFTGDGIATVDFGQQYNECWGLAIQTNGAILAGGVTFTGTYSFALARLTTTGGLDSSFDGDGKVTLSSTFGQRATVALQSDGKVLMAGSLNTRFCLARYNTNGTLDTTFDVDGVLTTTIAGSTGSGALAVAVQPAVSGQPERIVAAGWALVGSRRFAVARYNLNGALDTTFDADGMQTHGMGTTANEANAVLVQGEKITVAGFSRSGGESWASIARFNLNGSLDGTFAVDYVPFWAAVPLGNVGFGLADQAGNTVLVGHGMSHSLNRDLMILRFLTNGTFDPSFDGDGIRLQDVTDVAATLGGAALQADGRIVVAGYLDTSSTRLWAIARLEPDGSLDPSFGSAGKVAYFGNGSANAVTIQPDGRIVVVGTYVISGNVSHFAILRLTADGALDPEFGFGDLVDTAIGSGNADANSVTVQADGKIVVAGTATNGGTVDMALVRYNTDGSLDTSFSGDGIATTTVGTGDDFALDAAVQPDGKIVLCGAAVLAGGFDVALVRFLANGSIDNGFGSFGRVATDLGGAVDAATAMVLQPDGKMVVAGYTDAAGYDFAVLRYNANGTLDTSFDGDGKVVTSIGLADDVGTCIARQADGKLLVGGYAFIGADVEGSLARYESNGALDAGYGFGGKAVVSFDPAQDIPGALILDPQGRAIMAATSGTRFAVARVEGDGGVTAIGGDSLAAIAPASRIVRVTPNPAGGRQSFALNVAAGQPIAGLSVYNVAGRLVWRRDLGNLAPGSHEIAWDGRTDSGEAAANGVYFARLDGVRTAPSVRLVRLR